MNFKLTDGSTEPGPKTEIRDSKKIHVYALGYNNAATGHILLKLMAEVSYKVEVESVTGLGTVPGFENGKPAIKYLAPLETRAQKVAAALAAIGFYLPMEQVDTIAGEYGIVVFVADYVGLLRQRMQELRSQVERFEELGGQFRELGKLPLLETLEEISQAIAGLQTQNDLITESTWEIAYIAHALIALVEENRLNAGDLADLLALYKESFDLDVRANSVYQSVKALVGSKQTQVDTVKKMLESAG